jgi:phosphoglycolate phosphatase
VIKAVLFDLDGTLLNTLDDLADAANYALAARGYPVHPVEAYKYFVGNGVITLMERILPPERNNKEEIDAALEIYLPYYKAHSADKTAPYDGVNPLLSALAELGVKRAVVTNKPNDQALEVISRYFGEASFGAVCGNIPGLPPKPDPETALKALCLLGASPEEALFLGDTKVDMLTAKNAGATPIGALWGFRSREELSGHGAARIIERPLELLDIIKEFNGGAVYA